jgi:hypothetical protein
MPRMDPLRKKNIPPNQYRRDRQEPVAYFLRRLFFPASEPSESSITEELLETLSPIWDKNVAPTLLSAFGDVTTLYAIFYAPDTPEREVILEVWDPIYVDSKPSEVFRFKGIPNVAARLPSSRSEAKVITLENWY